MNHTCPECGTVSVTVKFRPENIFCYAHCCLCGAKGPDLRLDSARFYLSDKVKELAMSKWHDEVSFVPPEPERVVVTDEMVTRAAGAFENAQDKSYGGIDLQDALFAALKAALNGSEIEQRPTVTVYQALSLQYQLEQYGIEINVEKLRQAMQAAQFGE